MTASAPRNSGDIQAVHRVAEILRLFTANQPRVTVAEAAARIGLNRTTAHRYFGSLVLDNILERSKEEPTAFVPGPLLLQLGAVAHGQRRVLDAAPPHLRQLSVETALTVVLSLWGEAGAVVSLTSEAGAPPILMTVRIGSTLGPDSAQTRLFGAFMRDRGVIDRYLTRQSRAQRRAFLTDLQQCRERALARNDMTDIDASVVAAPVFDKYDIAATIGLVGTTSSLAPGTSAREKSLLRTAFRITDELDGGPTWVAAIGSMPE